ncbi:leucine-rich repeat protein [Labilibaculum antarcticum]|uniref:Secretion system C-terminal sorting domain-containing protein n=1 Tax=Labilibaculum antarcticum TaxID=1717717 RepID=A0A1Y1CGC5_9BACT|nr:leucine-rich repeat protein [Labilibaculum antarcticum]BAX79340.1 hypothetical protein ALGA_0953 [Labilibaculum antarcticum]
MNKRILLSQFIFVLLLTLSGTTYAQTTITIDDISFDAVNGEITSYSGTATDIIIPESFTVNSTVVTVKSIQYYTFRNKGLTSVSFPNTLTSIKFLSFADNLLTSVTLPPNLTELGKGAFSDNSITEINGKASNGIFLGLNADGTEDNTQLVCFGGTATEIDFIPSTVTVIQSYAFANCGLTSVEIPDGVVELHDGAFQGNELTTLVLPNSVTTFHSRVFSDNKLTSVTLSENLTSIGYYAFENNLLTSIDIPEGVTSIKNDAFKGNLLTSVTLPNSLKTISLGSFQNNEISSLTLNEGLEEIGYYAFQNNKLVTLTIPASVTSIQPTAFSSNELSSVTFEANSHLESISANAFSNNALLTAIKMPTHANAQCNSYADENGVEYLVGENITDFTIAYRAKIVATLTIDDVTFNSTTGSISNYIGTATDIVIPESFTVDGSIYAITEIADNTFESSIFTGSSISSVVLPETIQKMGEKAFYGNSLSQISIPEGCELGEQCFGRNKLKTITIPAGITEIPSTCFSYNDIIELNIPASVKTIGSMAFAYNDITTLTLNEGLEDIGLGAFYYNKISKLSIPNSVVLVNRAAFSRNQITEVNLNESLELRGGAFADNKITSVNGVASDGVFYGLNEDGTKDNTKLTSYGGPESVIDFLSNSITVIDSSAFSNHRLSSIDLPASLTHIYSNAFSSTYVDEVSFPNTLKYIGRSAFTYNDLKTITFPASIEYIGSYAFSFGDLTSVTFESESNIQFIGEVAFYYNDGLNDPIVLPTSSITGFINYYDNNGTVYIAGSGFLNDEEGCFARYKKTVTLDDIVFDETTGTITDYIGEASDIIIPESFAIDGEQVVVKIIGEKAFYSNKLFSVEMANSITKIEAEAFRSNNNMESVVLSTGLLTIGKSAFSNSVPDEGIDLPDTGIWNKSYYYTPGTEITKIESSSSYYYHHLVYTANFVDYDATVLKTQIVVPEGSATAPSNPTRTGYTFSGWDVAFDNITANTTVKAEYIISTYTVSFEDYDGTLKSEIVDYGTAATAPSNPTRTGYTFTAWDVAFNDITANITVTAEYSINTYTVRFEDYDGTLLKSEIVDYGSAATAPSNSTHTGYTLTGWNVAFDNITANTTVTAEFTINSYTVWFEDYDGTLLKSQSVNYSSDAIAPSNPTRTAYTFTGWDVDFENISEDITVTAKYSINTYTVWFEDYDGTLLKSESVEYGSAATAPSNPTRTGYTFTGWDVAFDNITANTIVTAELVINTYTVRFENYDGTLLKSESVEYGSAATAPSNPTRTAYTFTGWDVAFDNITANTIVTAELVINTYTVRFENYDGTLLESQIINYNAAAIAPSNPTRTGYTFTRWDVTFDNITDNITVTAEYLINTYTVSFEDYDGTLLTSESVEYGSAAFAPSDPTRTEYTFTGWDSDYSNVTANMTVTAQYTINTYTVTFEDWDGTELTSVSVNYGSDASAPSDPTRSGYTFTGWDSDYNNITEDITITAQYTITTTYTVTFKDWDATQLASESVEYGSAAFAPSDPTRTEYTFTGWDSDFSNVTANMTITAQYTINTYTVTFEDWDGTQLASENVEYGNAASAPSNPIRIGYTFTDWNSDYSNITEDSTVTAQYTINTYTVTFEDWDGTQLASENVEYGNAASAPSNPIRIGYTFTDWNSDYSNITEDSTVTAQYTINTYTVTFEDWDGTQLASENVEYGNAASAPSNPIRTGYTFTAWDVIFDDITDNITVTAQYDITTGIEINTNTEYSVYPNPVRDILTIDFDNADYSKEHKISIYNNSGQIIYSNSDYGSKMSISVANWNAGIYFIIVDNRRTKIIKL